MSGLWMIALRYALWMVVLAVPIGLAVNYVYGEAYAGALFYGVGTGILSFVSIAFTVSLLTGRSNVSRILGILSFIVRYGLVAIALGIPAYYELWPVLAMIAGFAGVYLAENVILLPMVLLRPAAGREARG